MSAHQSTLANGLEQIAGRLLIAAQQACDGREAAARTQAAELAGRLLAVAGPVDTVRAVADARAAVAALETVAAGTTNPNDRLALSAAVGQLLGRLAAVQAGWVGSHPLTQIRAGHGWSNQALARLVAKVAAEQLGIRNMAGERQKVWRWEHGVVTPDTVSQLALALLLGVPRVTVLAEPWPAWLRHALPAAVPADGSDVAA